MKLTKPYSLLQFMLCDALKLSITVGDIKVNPTQCIKKIL